MQFNKFVFGGILILGAVVFLIWSSTTATQEYFMTVDELHAKGTNITDKNLRLSGAVIGDTIQYDAASLTLSFDVAHVSGDNADLETEGGLAIALHEAVTDPTRSRIKLFMWDPARSSRNEHSHHDGHLARTILYARSFAQSPLL